MNYITADLHFWHKNTLVYYPEKRPFKNIEEMNESLISEWNENVSDGDTIYFLGDFSFKGFQATEEMLKRLNGKKIMIIGNHDKKLRHLYEKYFDEVHDYLEFDYNGTKLCMMHFPLACWNCAARGSVMLHGHTHGVYKGVGRILDVGYDSLGKIMKLDDVVNMALEKKIETLD